MITFYILDDDNNPIPTFDLMEFDQFMCDIERRRVAVDTIAEYWISTVFLGLNLQTIETVKPPLLFETAVFNPDGIMEVKRRYTTWSEAAKGHRYICAQIAETSNLEAEGLIAFIGAQEV